MDGLAAAQARSQHLIALLVGAIGVSAGLAFWGRSQARARVEAERLAQQRRRISRLAMRMLADPLPVAQPDGAYLFHQLDCNLESTVRGALTLVRRFPFMPILVLDVRNELLAQGIEKGFGGAPELLRHLERAGVPRGQLQIVPWDHEAHPMIHTLIEAQLAVRHAKLQGWNSLMVVAVPFHLPRAGATTASIAAREYPELRVFAHPGGPLPWEEHAMHSQGMQATRLEFLDSELDRIERYMAKGDILLVEDIEARFLRRTGEVPPVPPAQPRQGRRPRGGRRGHNARGTGAGAAGDGVAR